MLDKLDVAALNWEEGHVKELKTAVKRCLTILKPSEPLAPQMPPNWQTSSEESGGHVMISYSWDNKQVVLQLKEKMKEAKIPTWIDCENMPSDSVLAGMAEAVEGSELMVICYSEGYKRSANCRMEAEYGYKTGKNMLFVRVQPRFRPDGWLGLLLAASLYYDISGELFEANSLKVLQEVKRKMGMIPNIERPKEIADNKTSSSSGQKSDGEKSGRMSHKNKLWKIWTTEQVQKWLDEMDLDFIKKEFVSPLFIVHL